jgi:cysteine desulfurase
MSRKRIYLDYAATTPLDPRVMRAMGPFFAGSPAPGFGNPSSIHAEGVAAKRALDNARTFVARSFEAHADEIIFTSGGTESNNLSIFGTLFALPRFDLSPDTRSNLVKPHMVTTNIEHASILEPIRELEKRGVIEVAYVPVEQNGIVKPEKIIAAIRPNTVLVSVMYANNEIGTIQPIAKIGKALRDLRNRQLSTFNFQLSTVKNRFPIFHTDACQAPLYLNCLVNALGVDLMTLDGHKMYGPKGIGALYVRRGTPLKPLILGGGQERGLRSTTENVPGIAGLAEALRIAAVERKAESIRLEKLRDYLYSTIRANGGIDMVVNGSMEKKERLPNNLNISLPGVDTEFLTLQLDARGVAVSTKSSCLKDEKSSYVVAALGGNKKRSSSTLRFTLGRWTKKSDIEYAAKTLAELLQAEQ